MRFSRPIVFLACAVSPAAADYTTNIGGTPYTVTVTAMAVDANGNAYLTGSRSVPASETGGTNIFVSKVDRSGNPTLLATLGGNASDRANGIALDPSGNIYVAGGTASTNFPLHNPLQSVPASPTVPSQDGTVLVVEDERLLRQAVVKMLRKNGFEVFEASDGSSAIDLLRANGARIDAILLDMTIPGASCHEILAEAANVTPDIRVILTSAYSQEAIAAAMSPPQIRSFIRKPFQLEELVKTFRSCLAS